MKKVKPIGQTIKYAGGYYGPSDVIEMDDVTYDILIKQEPCPIKDLEIHNFNDKPTKEEPKEEIKLKYDPVVIEELMEVEGVTENIAKALIDNGVDKIEDLQALSIDDLKGVKGVGLKVAKKIFDDAKNIEVEVE